MKLKVILTGATGMAGEGVLFECLQNPEVSEVLVIGRRHYDLQHPKLNELLVPDFFQLDEHAERLKGYHACFFCAGISSIGLNEEKFTHITYDTTMAFARSVFQVNPQMTFCYITGSGTDSSEKGPLMWARVKGRTENDLMKLSSAVYNFHPGALLPFKGQQNWKSLYKVIARIFRFFAPAKVLTLQEVGRAMIRTALSGYEKHVLEISDIRKG